MLVLLACLACLLALMLLLAAWHVFWAPFQLLGMTLDFILETLGISRACAGSRTGPGTAQWAGLLSRPGGAVFYQDPGIQGTARVDGDLMLLGPTINLTTTRFKELSIQNCMI